MGYLIPARPARVEQEIKRSRFIGIATGVSSKAEVERALEEIRKEFPTATHHCWAYVLGDPRDTTAMRTNDDGEPTGTAGKPILSALQHKGVGDVLVVVVRYFGGIKLGAGGLVRAYSSTASRVMDALSVVEKTRRIELTVTLAYEDEAKAQLVLKTLGGNVLSSHYEDLVRLRIGVDETQLDSIRHELKKKTKGRARLSL